MVWSVPRMWEGQAVAVLASGPSMSQKIADRVKHLPCIAINTTFRLAPWATMLYAADRAWWLHPEHGDAWQHPGMRVSIDDVPGVRKLHNSGVLGFDPNPECVRTGGNSGYQAIHIAAHAGASRILLIGFDMRGGHWHGDHPQGLVNTVEETFHKWRGRFESLAASLPKAVHVINCTPGSALRAFESMELEHALEGSFAAS